MIEQNEDRVKFIDGQFNFNEYFGDYLYVLIEIHLEDNSLTLHKFSVLEEMESSLIELKDKLYPVICEFGDLYLFKISNKKHLPIINWMLECSLQPKSKIEEILKECERI